MNIQNSAKEFMIWFIKKKITTPPNEWGFLFIWKSLLSLLCKTN